MGGVLMMPLLIISRKSSVSVWSRLRHSTCTSCRLRKGGRSYSGWARLTKLLVYRYRSLINEGNIAFSLDLKPILGVRLEKKAGGIGGSPLIVLSLRSRSVP